jgi:predicted RNA methylase
MTAKTRRIPDDVLDVLGRSTVSQCAGQGQLVLPEQLDRKLYVAVNKVIENLGGEWRRHAKAHVFPGVLDLPERIEGALATGEFVSLDDNGCFYTPDDLADRVIELADIEPGMYVLEPSAGRGALASRAAAIVGPLRVICGELLIENVAALHLQHDYLSVAEGDFLASGIPCTLFDRVVMNPPFAKSADVDHVTHAWKFVKPGGRLVAIMSAGVQFRSTSKYETFRGLVFQEGRGRIIDNPEGSFKSAGTDVRTVTVVMDKPL